MTKEHLIDFISEFENSLTGFLNGVAHWREFKDIEIHWAGVKVDLDVQNLKESLKELKYELSRRN